MDHVSLCSQPVNVYRNTQPLDNRMVLPHRPTIPVCKNLSLRKDLSDTGIAFCRVGDLLLQLLVSDTLACCIHASHPSLSPVGCLRCRLWVDDRQGFRLPTLSAHRRCGCLCPQTARCSWCYLLRSPCIAMPHVRRLRFHSL